MDEGGTAISPTGAQDHELNAIEAFAAAELGRSVTRVVRVDSFATNAVYEVDAGGQPFVVKASRLHDAIRAETWAGARGAEAGCAAPAILGSGRIRINGEVSVFIMPRIPGQPVTGGHVALSEAGARLRRLHDDVRLPGFGSLVEASWDERGDFTLRYDSWLGYLRGICRDAGRLADCYAVAATVSTAAAATTDAHAQALAAVEVGSLCHGDLKAKHILVEADRLTGVIDWGDAMIGDPLWDIARFAHRTDAGSVSRLLEGYDPEGAMSDEVAWRLPLYGALWRLLDAVISHHQLGRRVEADLEAVLVSLR